MSNNNDDDDDKLSTLILQLDALYVHGYAKKPSGRWVSQRLYSTAK